MPTWLLVALTAAGTWILVMVVRQFLPPEKAVQHSLEHLYGVRDDQFLRSMGNLLPPAVLQGNRITPLINGDEIFPAMLGAIRAAKHTVCLETFIYWSGRIGQEFADAIGERARAGVRVHVLLDWLGSMKMDSDQLAQLERDGVDVQRYHRPSWYTLGRLNNRTHRKLLVVDGRVGFTGGVGIADEWTGNGEDPQHWRDTHFQLEGPAVAQVQAAFMDNWLKTHDRVLHGRDYFPPLEPLGESSAQLFMSSPQEGSESVRLMYLLSITAAEESVRLASAYFVPDDLSVETLVAAQRRGAVVEIVVPGAHIDTQTVRRASRSRWGKLLEAGIAIYEYQPTMYHTKVMIVDGVWVSVGSTNFDNRSFRLNDEANLNVHDPALAAHQIRCFEEDRSRSRRVDLAAWRKRPLREKLVDHAAGLLRWQL